MTEMRRPAKPSVTPFARSAPLVLLVTVLVVLLAPIAARADGPSVGTQLQNTEIRDAKDEPSKIPDFGKKVLLILYLDCRIYRMSSRRET